MNLQKKSVIIFLSIIFLAFNAIYFLAGGISYPLSVWIAYGLMCFSYILSLFAFFKNVNSIFSIYFILNVVMASIIAFIKPNNHITVIIVEVIIHTIVVIAMYAILSADKHTAKSQRQQSDDINYIRSQAKRIEKLIGVYAGGKFDKCLENIYDDLHAFPVRSVNELLKIKSSLDTTVIMLENALQNGDNEKAEQAISKLTLLIENCL